MSKSTWGIFSFLAILLVLLGYLFAIAVGIAVASIPAVILFFAWKLIAVAIFGAPALTFLQVWLCFAALGVIFGLLRK